MLAPVLDFNKRSASEQYVESLPPQIKQAVKDKKAVEGMDREQVVLALVVIARLAFVAPRIGDLLFRNDISHAAKVTIPVAFVLNDKVEFKPDLWCNLR